MIHLKCDYTCMGAKAGVWGGCTPPPSKYLRILGISDKNYRLRPGNIINLKNNKSYKLWPNVGSRWAALINKLREIFSIGLIRSTFPFRFSFRAPIESPLSIQSHLLPIILFLPGNSEKYICYQTQTSFIWPSLFYLYF